MAKKKTAAGRMLSKVGKALGLTGSSKRKGAKKKSAAKKGKAKSTARKKK